MPAICAAAIPAGALTIHSLNLSGSNVGRYEPLFIHFGLDQSYQNPFDPRQIDVTCEFTGPSGQTRSIPAFFANDNPGWEARIAPLELGPHTGRIIARDADDNIATADFAFTAIASASPGFVRVDDRNPYYMRFDNHEPYFPLGHNACWGGVPGYFASMGQYGATWSRYWVVPFTGGDVEWNGGGGTLGYYDETTAINNLDSLIQAAANHGIYVQMCLDSFTGWNIAEYHNWYDSPYNNDNGGMLENPIDYFYNAEARRLAKQRYRYIVARWAYSTNVLCWEFWNEVDAVGWGQDWSLSFWSHLAAVRAWHADMGDYIRSIDPFQHLRTTSFANTAPWIDDYNSFWALDQMDIVQAHRYSLIYPSEQIATIRQYQIHDKPTILGEAGIAPVPPNDSSGTLLHDLIWPAAVCQSGAMSWWWDNWIDIYNLYHHLAPLAAFLEGEDFAPEHLHEATATRLSGPPEMQIYGSSGSRSAYLWLLYWYGEISNASIRVTELDPGDYTVEYWNTFTGVLSSASTITVGTQGATLNIPTFHRNVAIKLKARLPHLVVSPLAIMTSAYHGFSPDIGQITIENTGHDTATYTISSSEPWITPDPAVGTIAEEADIIDLAYDTAGLLPGTHTAQVTVSSPEAPGEAPVVAITLTIHPIPIDPDFDGDTDQSDYGRFQACLAVGQSIAPGCETFDLNRDGYIDALDSQVFRSCMTGANIPLDPACLE